MAHKGHWFHCGHCGYNGEESELPHETDHECGDDKCPECKQEGNIVCCFDSYENAEIEHHQDDVENCSCSKCHPELYVGVANV